MKTRAVVVGALCAASALGMGGTAFAGEVTGSGKGGPAGDGIPGGIGTASSECVFSGLQDQPLDPGTVQNWGHAAEDPFFTILDSTGAAFVTAILHLPTGDITVEIGCNPHAGAEG